ncbi:HAUS augmin-like complex subunit 6 N-terminus-domain-containing protein [Plectosphaerella plurivora]|uniref:HAUS augmin-like complex subunit 6 N-terminus-domain-containing protein n=1 Tax=Plectosphaerella plurivora TaxID=936078 RepID=A0A9P8VB21_9PEZI|nr:HAUS augmin-like complex subunit 6 N-terminus-domain-containing protein [Plectosphaerella plurivora]
MAALPPNSLLARSRSIRTGNTAKPAAASAPAPPPPAAVAASPSHSSHMHTFLTNLRLLDLDALPDWPEFDAQTFSVQKRRIQAVEWALYQLFCLWDPEEARTKLEPFFPPRDQVQSINLRSALQRCLEHAKKNGVLGRDAVVRKTMLDECKGERLEEVLAVFSSTVLKKLVAAATDAQGKHPAIAQQLALEERGYTGEKTDLLVLGLAHKASLSRALREKDTARRQYRDLSDLLDLKERSIARRTEELKAQKLDDSTVNVTEDVRLDTQRTLRNNWAGNEEWMETLIGGDARARRDGVLSAPFDRVWRRVQSDRLSELEDEGKGLLERLDGRVRAQRESLQKWKDFRHEMFGSDIEPPTEERKPKDPTRGIDFGFGGHENLRLGQTSPRKQKLGSTPKLQPEYASLLRDLKSELAEVNAAPAVSLASLLGPRMRQPTRPQAAPVVEDPIESTEETISELSDLDDRPVPAAPPSPVPEPAPKPAPRMRIQAQPPSRSRSLRDTYSAGQGIPASSLTRHASLRTATTSSSSSSREAAGSPSPTRRIFPEIRLDPDPPSSPEPASPTTAMADQILASMDNASPSPVKQSRARHTLSLAERTRLSMARMSRGGAKFADPYEEEEDVPSRLQPSITKQADPVLEEEEADLAYEDLAARTRRSLAGFEATREKAQLERRRSQRRSRMPPRPDGQRFPSVEEENGGISDAEPTANVEVDADMEAIFKSRPKLQNSPTPSPTKHWDE